MNALNGVLEYAPRVPGWRSREIVPPERANGTAAAPPPCLDPELLRRCAWEIGERRPTETFHPKTSHVGLGMVTPHQGFAHWRILPEWVDRTAQHKGNAWHSCRLVLRLYDVSCIEFNGFNAHHIQDHGAPSLCGRMFFKLSRPGTWQLAEVGFLLRHGEFVPAARSQVVAFPPEGASSRGSTAGLLVTGRGRVEEIGNVWDQERVLRERLQPRLRQPLRLAAFTLASPDAPADDPLARFVRELAAGQCAAGHEVHVFAPAAGNFNAQRETSGVHYHPLDVPLEGPPVEVSKAFGRAANKRLRDVAPFDVIHCHEWMAARAGKGQRKILSLGSIESTRRNGTPASDVSREIEQAERQLARSASCVLTPPWLRDRAVADLELDEEQVRAFPMEGRMPNEWESPLDPGQVKMEIGFGPFDRLIVYVGPLEHAAGVDVLLEALPTLLHRAGNLRLAYLGAGNMRGSLEHRSHQLGVGHAVRFLGHVHAPRVTRLVRSAEALVLPSRYRVPFDDAVVDLARRAGRPVVTTHSGPAHLVRHEDNGLVTYDNPGSMVWALDRLLGDPGHAERMGRNGQRRDEAAVVWSDVARHYLDLCAALFSDLTQAHA